MMMPGAAGQFRAELFAALRGFPTPDPAPLVRTTVDLLLRALSDRWGMCSADGERLIVGEVRTIVAEVLADEERRDREARAEADRQRQREEQRQGERRRDAERQAVVQAAVRAALAALDASPDPTGPADIASGGNVVPLPRPA